MACRIGPLRRPHLAVDSLTVFAGSVDVEDTAHRMDPRQSPAVRLEIVRQRGIGPNIVPQPAPGFEGRQFGLYLGVRQRARAWDFNGLQKGWQANAKLVHDGEAGKLTLYFDYNDMVQPNEDATVFFQPTAGGGTATAAFPEWQGKPGHPSCSPAAPSPWPMA